MQDNHSYGEILTMLQAGVSAEEIAKDFTDTLNAAEAEYKRARGRAMAEAVLEELTEQINVALQKYSSVYGSQNKSLNTFTVDEIREAFNAKIEGKNLNVKLNIVADPKQAAKVPTQAGQKKMSLQEFVDNMSEDELTQAWNDAVQHLVELFGNK